jgi:hypothetical protein
MLKLTTSLTPTKLRRSSCSPGMSFGGVGTKNCLEIGVHSMSYTTSFSRPTPPTMTGSSLAVATSGYRPAVVPIRFSSSEIKCACFSICRITAEKSCSFRGVNCAALISNAARAAGI